MLNLLLITLFPLVPRQRLNTEVFHRLFYTTSLGRDPDFVVVFLRHSTGIELSSILFSFLVWSFKRWLLKWEGIVMSMDLKSTARWIFTCVSLQSHHVDQDIKWSLDIAFLYRLFLVQLPAFEGDHVSDVYHHSLVLSILSLYENEIVHCIWVLGLSCLLLGLWGLLYSFTYMHMHIHM